MGSEVGVRLVTYLAASNAIVKFSLGLSGVRSS